MLFVEFETNVQDKKYQIKSKSDFVNINKYFNDLPLKLQNKLAKIIIKYWNKKKLKIINPEDLAILAHYVGFHYGYKNLDDLDVSNELDEFNNNKNITNITIAGKYNFSFVSYNKNDIRQENIFKLNFYNIIETLKHYFPQVNLKIDFEKATYVDSKLKKASTTYKHDAIITITPKNDDILEDDYNPEKTFEIVLEYFEKIHNRFNDDDKKISTNLFSDDEYYVFDVNKDDMKEFITDTIYGIIQTICAATNDEYELSKILYFDKNNNNRNLIRQVEYFSEIISIFKTNKFNFNDFYNRTIPRNIDTEKKITKKKFKKILENMCDFELNNDNDIYNSETFEKIIIHYDNKIILSERIVAYKNLLMFAMKCLLKANKKIIDILQKQRHKRMQLPQFIRNFQKFHKDNMKNT
jgi:hypothetical protein